MDETAVSTLFWHYLADESAEVQRKLGDEQTGPYLFFRRSKTPIQARLEQLMSAKHIPRVFLHGSPHIDNYAKMNQGYGMIDFDRAYIGPYIWDIVCVLLAINLRNPQTHYSSLNRSVLETFYEEYLSAFQNPESTYQAYVPLAKITPKKWEEDIHLYLTEKHKWAKKLDKAALALHDPIALTLLAEYKKNLPEAKAWTSYQLTQLARTAGSFGRRRYLFLLEDPVQTLPPIMLDIKETRNYLEASWPHNKWYHSPCSHQGQRMIKAAQLYAPDCIALESFATVNGTQYWGRQVPTLNRKPAKLFTADNQVAFALAAASQLGRGHRLGLQEKEPADLMNHFKQHFTELVAITEKIQSELLTFWQLCIKRKAA